MKIPTNTVEFLRACGITHKTHMKYWYNTGIYHGNKEFPRFIESAWIDEANCCWAYNGPNIGLSVIKPIDADHAHYLLSNCIKVFGPMLYEKKRRVIVAIGFVVDRPFYIAPHQDFLKEVWQIVEEEKERGDG